LKKSEGLFAGFKVMKNKHIVLVFILTLILGLAVRRAPWRSATFFQTSLLKLDTATVQQMQITLPGKPTLFLQREDHGWSAEQEEHSVLIPSDMVQMMLGTLTDIRSIRVAKTDQPDTLGFSRASSIQLKVIHSGMQEELLMIGWETIENEQAATYVQLPNHAGIYLVNNQLRGVFAKGLSDFRTRTIARFESNTVKRFSIFNQGVDSLVFQKSDSMGVWINRMSQKSISNAEVQTWLSQIASLNGLSFADLYDESHANELVYASIQLNFEGQTDALHLKIYKQAHLNVPEILPARKPDRRQLSLFVLHSSQNPNNYFSLADTLLMNQICHPF
jgi:hypothetical protein